MSLFILVDKEKEGKVNILGHVRDPVCMIVLFKVWSAVWCQFVNRLLPVWDKISTEMSLYYWMNSEHIYLQIDIISYILGRKTYWDQYGKEKNE